MAKASPTIDIELMRSLLDRVEQLGRIEPAPLHGDDAAADHQVAERVEQPGAVHQRRRGQVARPGLDDPCGCRAEVLLRRQALLVRRVEGAEQVVLAPHDALRHAGGAARVEQQEVIAGAAPRRHDRLPTPTTRLPRSRRPSPDAVRCRRRPTATCGCAAADGASPRCARRTHRGRRRPRRRRCPTGTPARRPCSGSSC